MNKPRRVRDFAGRLHRIRRLRKSDRPVPLGTKVVFLYGFGRATITAYRGRNNRDWYITHGDDRIMSSRTKSSIYAVWFSPEISWRLAQEAARV